MSGGDKARERSWLIPLTINENQRILVATIMKKDSFNLGKGLLLSATITGYLLAPLVVIGGIGLLLDRRFSQGNHWILFVSLAISFIVGNILVVKKSEKIAGDFIKQEKIDE